MEVRASLFEVCWYLGSEVCWCADKANMSVTDLLGVMRSTVFAEEGVSLSVTKGCSLAKGDVHMYWPVHRLFDRNEYLHL